MNNILAYLIFILIIGLMFFYISRYKYFVKKLIKMTSSGKKNINIRIRTFDKDLSSLASNINNISNQLEEIESGFRLMEKTREEFLAGISHDIRTPLTSIIGYSDAILDEFNREGKFNPEYIKVISDKSAKLKNRIDRFFELTKLLSGDIQMIPEKIDAAETIREIIIDFYPELQKLSIETEFITDSSDPVILFDRLSLIRIMENLIKNVILHASSGKYLGIHLYNKKGQFIIDVIDRGKGLTLNQMESIFKRNVFFSNSGVSNGIGLAIVEQLTLKNNASILCKNNGNNGTIFSVSTEISKK